MERKDEEGACGDGVRWSRAGEKEEVQEEEERKRKARRRRKEKKKERLKNLLPLKSERDKKGRENVLCGMNNTTRHVFSRHTVPPKRVKRARTSSSVMR